MDDQLQAEQQADMLQLAIEDTETCKKYFTTLRKAYGESLVLKSLAHKVAKLLAEVHDEDITINHLGF